MTTGEQRVQTISMIALAMVVAIVLLGSVRVALAHWSYLFLTAALGAGAYYLFSHMER